jgi:hypothetical protein
LRYELKIHRLRFLKINLRLALLDHRFTTIAQLPAKCKINFCEQFLPNDYPEHTERHYCTEY